MPIQIGYVGRQMQRPPFAFHPTKLLDCWSYTDSTKYIRMVRDKQCQRDSGGGGDSRYKFPGSDYVAYIFVRLEA
jgi:hypothetical protein